MAGSKIKITDVAHAAGVSQSTASFVLSGRGDEMHISKDTQELVWKLSKELGYRPSNLARRMRKSLTTGVPTVTLFWTAGIGFTTLARSLTAIQNSILRNEMNIQVVLKTYVTGHLSEVLNDTTHNYFNGAIIGGASVADIKMLASADLHMPLVFFDRNIPNYNSVYTSLEVGSLIAKRLSEKGFTNAVVLTTYENASTQILRYNSIRHACKEFGIKVRLISPSSEIINLINGRETTTRLMTGKNPPEVLIYLQEEIAVGGIDALHGMNLKSGRDVEVIAFGTADYLDYLGMPISRFRPNLSSLADCSLKLLLEQIENNSRSPQHIVISHDVTYTGRLK